MPFPRMGLLTTLRSLFPRRGRGGSSLNAVTSRVDDGSGAGSGGWMTLTGRLGANYAPHDYEPSRVQELYQDALSAWRRNPIAWRIVAITTDYVVGDSLTLSSPNRGLNRFIDGFWNHPKNRISLLSMTVLDFTRDSRTYVYQG